MSFTLDVYNKKKQCLKRDINILDRRIFKGGRNKEENLIEELKKELINLEIDNIKEYLNDLLKLGNKLKYLNFYLLINVYTYFREKNFDLSLVFLNFEKDFNEELKIILANNPYKNDLKEELNKYKFRQDYIIYLFLLEKINYNDISYEGLIDEELSKDNELVDKQYFDGAVDYENIEEDDYQQDY